MFLTPGCDLHLLRAGPAQPVLIVPVGDNVTGDIAADPNTHYTGFSTAVVNVTGGVFTPAGVGETVVLITFNDPNGPPQTALVRVHVHAAITRLWLANRSITLRAGSADYVPSVYATFDDGPVVDVTGHAYVTVSAAPGAPFTVNAGDPLGRLHAPANASGIGTVVAQAGGFNAFASVMIAPALTSERHIVERIRYQGDHAKHRNILFLAEGYASKQLFDKHVRALVDRMFTSPMYSPFPQLAHRFNAWSAYEPWGLGDPGITIGTPITDDGSTFPVMKQADAQHYSSHDVTLLVGLPPGPGSPTSVADAQATWTAIPGFDPARLDETSFDGWRKQTRLEPTAPKDSLFGVIFGTRSGGPMAPPVRPRTGILSPPANPHWELQPPLDARTMTFDVRRLPAHAMFPAHYNPDGANAPNELFQPYLESLKYGDDPNHVDFHIGRVWTNTGADEGLIVLLVYGDLFGGTAISFHDGTRRHRVAIMVSVGDNKQVRITSGTPPREYVPKADKPNIDKVATKVVHELAHALGLGDEYENTDGTGDQDGRFAPREELEERTNLMHYDNIIDALTGNVIANNIKWNWDRIVMASELVSIDPPSPTELDRITFGVAPGQAVKWTKARAQNIDVFLRVRNINAPPPQAAPLGPFKIIDITGDKLTLRGPTVPVLTYTVGSILYQPAMNGTARRTVVHDAVRNFLVNNPPFGVNTATNEEGETPPAIPNLSKPKHRESVIGVYDGAGTFNTNAFRPAGNCRMRNVDYWTVTEFRWALKIIPWFRSVPRVRQFCFVCKYALVNDLGPEAFDILDREYPEDC